MSEQRELGKITAVLADMGLEVTYAYDDLVFVQHSAFLLQFTDDSQKLKLFINTECDPLEANARADAAVSKLSEASFEVTLSGQFKLEQNDDETLRVEFV